MQTLMKTLVIASTLLAGTVSATGFAMAGSDGAYHWGYPDSLKRETAEISRPFQGFSLKTKGYFEKCRCSIACLNHAKFSFLNGVHR